MSAKRVASFVAAWSLAFMCGTVPSMAGEREKDAVGPEHAVLATSDSPKAMPTPTISSLCSGSLPSTADFSIQVKTGLTRLLP